MRSERPAAAEWTRSRQRRLSEETGLVRLNESSEEKLLNRLAAIQAAVEILADNADLSPTERRRFVRVIRAESARLHQMTA